jgi:uncharacterized phage protein gp47/JayE
MAFTRPTLTALIAQAKSDIETHLAGSDAKLRRSVEGVIARTVAGLAHGLHGHLVWLSKQLIPDTAEDAWIVRWASIYGLTLTSATKASGSITVVGTAAAVCPIHTIWRTADGTTYDQDAEVTIPGGGSITADVTAVVAGIAGNQSTGSVLSLVTPVTGITSDATILTPGLAGGFDTETTASLLARLLLRLQTPPKGGGPGDYVSWALEVAGTTRAWEYANINGPGSVGVYFVCDALTPIIPTAPIVATMQAYLETKRPITAAVTAYAPTGIAFNRTIDLTPAGGSGTDTAAIRAAVDAELADLLTRRGYPGCTILVAQINEAISIAAGETDHLLISPATDVVYAAGTMPVTGTTTWA